jgi:hypothetical protein
VANRRIIARTVPIDLRPQRALLGGLVAACLLFAGAALGQTTMPPEKVAPPQAVTPPGVIKPPAQIDPHMRVRPPATKSFPTPVIKPKPQQGSTKTTPK